MFTVPAHSLRAPARAKLIAALRSMPGVCAVLGSSDPPGITCTPSCFHLDESLIFYLRADIELSPDAMRHEAKRIGAPLIRGRYTRPRLERSRVQSPGKRFYCPR